MCPATPSPKPNRPKMRKRAGELGFAMRALFLDRRERRHRRRVQVGLRGERHPVDHPGLGARAVLGHRHAMSVRASPTRRDYRPHGNRCGQPSHWFGCRLGTVLQRPSDDPAVVRRTQRIDIARAVPMGVLLPLEMSVLLTIAVAHFDAPGWARGTIAAANGIGSARVDVADGIRATAARCPTMTIAAWVIADRRDRASRSRRPAR